TAGTRRMPGCGSPTSDLPDRTAGGEPAAEDRAADVRTESAVGGRIIEDRAPGDRAADERAVGERTGDGAAGGRTAGGRVAGYRAADRATDALGNRVGLAERPRRIVSLVPSLTEALAATSRELLAGATDYCTHPADLDVPRVGGSRFPDLA